MPSRRHPGFLNRYHLRTFRQRSHSAIHGAQMSLSRIMTTVYRATYILAMYTGTRAAWNCVRSAVLPKPQAVILDRHRLRIATDTELLLRVHARATHPSLSPTCRSGMISARLVTPEIPSWLYAVLRMTSHFGCGHVEIAIYEESSRVVIYGIRNIINANAMRIGFASVLDGLRLSDESEAIHVLTEVRHALLRKGLKTSFAAPQSCVDLSVDPRLLHPKTRAKTLVMLKKRYTRLWKQADLQNTGRLDVAEVKERKSESSDPASDGRMQKWNAES